MELKTEVTCISLSEYVGTSLVDFFLTCIALQMEKKSNLIIVRCAVCDLFYIIRDQI